MHAVVQSLLRFGVRDNVIARKQFERSWSVGRSYTRHSRPVALLILL